MMTDLDIIKECRQTGRTRTTTKNLLEKAYYEQMNNEERIVKWKCPECGNYHKWVWSTYDIIGGEITMVCDNPECGATSKMFMIVEKNGNATAFVSAFNGNVEEKLRRATEKVMNLQMTEMYGGNTPIVPEETIEKWEKFHFITLCKKLVDDLDYWMEYDAQPSRLPEEYRNTLELIMEARRFIKERRK